MPVLGMYDERIQTWVEIHYKVMPMLVRYRDLQTCVSYSMQLVRTPYGDRKLREGNIGGFGVKDARNSSAECGVLEVMEGLGESS